MMIGDLAAARLLMAVSLGFHIVFACAGIAMPLLMIVAEGLWLRTGDAIWLDLARRWARGTAILFAVGAVSGTVLSFELGLLWPSFMAFAGPIIGMPFSLEGIAFFLEAIFLGIYLYGWERVSPRAHWLAGLLVLVCGTLSGVFVVTANGWMNTPAGFEMAAGRIVRVDPIAAMLNPAAFSQALHMTIAAFLAIGFAVAGIHAAMLLRGASGPFHRRAYALGLALGGVAAVLQPFSGDLSARHVARHQPAKFAAMEGQWETQRGAPLRIGGWPDTRTETTRLALEIPRGLSLLVHHDPDAEVTGLKAIPADARPPLLVVHLAFQIMVGTGMLLLATGCLGAGLWWRTGRLPDQRGYLRLVAICGPLGFLAVEAGWTVTEVGRQPWVIYGIMRTTDAVTPVPWLIVPLVSITLLYLVLSVVVLALLRRQVFETEPDAT